MKLKPICLAAIALLVANTVSADEEQEPNRWLVTLAHLEPLSIDERQFVLNMLGIDLSLEIINQAILEGQVPLEAFGGE